MLYPNFIKENIRKDHPGKLHQATINHIENIFQTPKKNTPWLHTLTSFFAKRGEKKTQPIHLYSPGSSFWPTKALSCRSCPAGLQRPRAHGAPAVRPQSSRRRSQTWPAIGAEAKGGWVAGDVYGLLWCGSFWFYLINALFLEMFWVK